MNAERAIYIHVPFCISKCFYCDFNSYPGMEEIFNSYAEAVAKEMQTAERGQSRGATLYIGGGTPTVMNEQQLMVMTDAARSGLGLRRDGEATIEANPLTVDHSKLEGLLTAGFNRISIGAQSFEDELLKRIGRGHTAAEARQAVADARLAGFANLSLDLIYSLPDQSLEMWRDTLRETVDLKPEHVSLYELTVEPGTPFAKLASQGKLDLPGEEQQIEMYSLAESVLESAGYRRYEISNFAKPGFECAHNQFYWRNDEYYGFGAGAVSYIGGKRMKNVLSPQEYVERIRESGSAVETSEELSPEGQMGETMMLGLRMTEGVDCIRFRERFGVDVDRIYEAELERLTEQGLVEFCDARLRLTHRGTLLANEVMAEFVRPEAVVSSEV
ncbi:MAG: radical SAM family heme chaperone HemW [Armatimonadota bacterium]|nr:radical SAM family heme chaperone HemW [Armatimonadota bacterium]